MGWGSGAGKGKILAPAAGDLVHVSAHNPFDGKMVLTDISGLAHRASKKQPKQVAQEGISQRQQQYVMQHLQGIYALGGKVCLVLDGRAYPPKKKERERRRGTSQQAVDEALAKEARNEDASKEWKAAARPAEPLWAWLMQECIDKDMPFIVAPYEADEQLVSLQWELGVDQAVIWAASEDSDLAAFGALEVIYDWNIMSQTYRSSRLMEQVVGKQVDSKFSFVGWNYDRFLALVIASGHDYFKHKKAEGKQGWGLVTVYNAMSAARLPPVYTPAVPHPPLHDRPAEWSTDAAVLGYVAPLLAKLPQADRATVGDQIVAACRAVRLHPVYNLTSLGPERLSWPNLSVDVAQPFLQPGLSMPPADASWAQQVPGIELDADAATATSDSETEDADPAVAMDASGVKLSTIDTVSDAKVLAFLGEYGVEVYANWSSETSRGVARRLLEQYPDGEVPMLKPKHPALHRHSRTRTNLKLVPGAPRGCSVVYDAVQDLKQSGLLLDAATRDKFLPFENTQARGYRLYDSTSGMSRATRVGNFSHAHSKQATLSIIPHEYPL
ncbi:hypothetical protein EMIHUDRAFT_203105 [Emiliania huxleyi CCMP1516]|uniref:XPG-I domain-containing protein n=2 Tax=Emiliania huxleyi TaxID=2903 RepID=A0A0D3K5J6_EMIH1|nr:hypothetical protein EMIHUDRAFT_203105 [Emiliania huxleyi CCMP1516]EOD31031.1 hypothetical protein EMIHUDRAFT_203105 [Emiliania huxleyi CCMP1516]|eukprot:XP_005783460.1 hypothetical protein EMIHUDRAFT_203105 [Emiliania huxleyi CCMP1516]